MRTHPITPEELIARRNAWLATQNLEELQQDPEADIDTIITKAGMNNEEAGRTHESQLTDWTEAEDARMRTSNIFDGVLSVPELSEFTEAGVDFASLQQAFEGYEVAGMEPALVFAPLNLPLESWRSIYQNLTEWQQAHFPIPPPDKPDPLAGNRLKSASDGDGLFVNPSVAKAWEDLNNQVVDTTSGNPVTTQDSSGQSVVWKVMVVPTASSADGGLVTSVSHNLAVGADNLTQQTQASNQAESDITQQSAHMPIGTYLTLQAGNILEQKPFIDTHTYTWTNGTFSNGERAPAVFWYPAYGRVVVCNYAVSVSDGDFGVRLPVWG